MRKVRQARLSNVPKATQLGRGGVGFELRHQRMLQAGSQEQTLGVRHFLIHPDIYLLSRSMVISWLGLLQKQAVSLEQTWVPVARAGLACDRQNLQAPHGSCNALRMGGFSLAGGVRSEEAGVWPL